MVQLFYKTPWFKDNKEKFDLTRVVEKYKYCIIIQCTINENAY